MGNAQNTGQSGSRQKLWIRRIGLLGFLFFLAKGLVWLAIGYLGFRSCD